MIREEHKTVADALAGNDRWRASVEESAERFGDEWRGRALSSVAEQREGLERFPPDTPLLTVQQLAYHRWELPADHPLRIPDDHPARELITPEMVEAVRWQFRRAFDFLDEFEAKLWDAILMADDGNLDRLERGFPVFVGAYKQWTRGDLRQRIEALPVNFSM